MFCLDCFSVGANNRKTHKGSHPYIVEERVNQPVYDEQWTAEDERKLLDVLSKYGLHNWRLVANELGTHSAKRCEDHYYAVYINHEHAPLPRELHSNDGSGNDETSRVTPETPVTTPRSEKSSLKRKLEDDEVDDDGDDDRQTPSSSVVKASTDTDAQELSGYLPKRGDFEVEFDDKAEHIIADLEVYEDDDEATIEKKAQLVEMYNDRLVERERVKKLIFENGLKRVEHLRRTRVKEQAEQIMDFLCDSEQPTRKRSRRKNQANVTLSSEAPTPNGLEHDH